MADSLAFQQDCCDPSGEPSELEQWPLAMNSKNDLKLDLYF